MIELARPWLLLLAPLPLLAWWWLPAMSAPAALRVPHGVGELLLGLLPNSRRRSPRWPVGLTARLLGWCALVFAVAGPYSPGDTLGKPTGRDLVVAIDLSESMQETDMLRDGQPVARYQVVRELLGRFIEQRRGDRIALVAFGHEAFLVTPLTFDSRAVAAALGELTIGLPGHRTDLGRAVGLAVQALRSEPPARRLLILLSDGEDNSGALTGLDAAALAAAHDIVIHSIGFSAVLDSDGAAILERMAARTGGQYFTARSAAALATVSARLDQLEPSATEAQDVSLRRDWSHVPIAVALLALAFVTGREVHAV